MITDALTDAPVERLQFVSRQMTGWILDFGTGIKDINAKYSRTTMELAMAMLNRVQSVADERGLDRAGFEWGPNVNGIISIYKGEQK